MHRIAKYLLLNLATIDRHRVCYRLLIVFLAPLAAYNVIAAEWELSSVMRAEVLNEVSGMSISHHDSELLWVINDSGGGNQLHAINRHSGINVASIVITGVINRDWEDLDSFHYQGRNWLLIGDIGDNSARRQFLHLYLLPEPLADTNGDFPAAIKPTADITFSYANGARDSESMAVSPATAEILIISKRDDTPQVYRLPLLLSTPDQPLTATRLAPIDNLQKPGVFDLLRFGQRARYIAQPTSLTISSSATDDSQLVALLTYKNVYHYRRQTGDNWQQTFARTPEVTLLPPLAQAEAITYDIQNQLLVTSEQLPAPVYRLSRTVKPEVIEPSTPD